MMTTRKFMIVIMILLMAVLSLAGCHTDKASSNDSAPKVDTNVKNRTADDGVNETKKKDVDVNNNNRHENKKRDIDESNEIKIGMVLTDATHHNTWIIYLLPDSVEIKNQNPYEFTCKARITTIEDEAIKEITLTKKLNEFEFYQKGGEIYYRSVNYMNFKNSGKVKGDAIASKIYNYVAKNM